MAPWMFEPGDRPAFVIPSIDEPHPVSSNETESSSRRMTSVREAMSDHQLAPKLPVVATGHQPFSGERGPYGLVWPSID